MFTLVANSESSAHPIQSLELESEEQAPRAKFPKKAFFFACLLVALGTACLIAGFVRVRVMGLAHTLTPKQTHRTARLEPLR